LQSESMHSCLDSFNVPRSVPKKIICTMWIQCTPKKEMWGL